MKKIMTLAAMIGVFAVSTVSAQTVKKVYPSDSPYSWKNNRHEIGLTTGFLPSDEDTVYEMTGYTTTNATGYYYDGYYDSYGGNHSVGEIIESSKYYLSEVRQSWAFNVNYYYKVFKWFQVGATASYHQVTRNKFSTVTHQRVGNYDRNFFSITPSVRFLYMNRPALAMYSGIGLGYGGVYIENEFNGKNEYADYLSTNLTFFGISAGKRLFANAELGLYTTGFIRFGVGYRF